MDKSCLVDDCLKKHLARGYCSEHYHKIYRKQYGQPLYMVWNGMRQRCNKPNAISYKNYGGRGVKVCDRWDKSYKAFEDDMLPTYKPGLTLDRIDNDGNYEPSNCKWSTREEQAKNKRPYPKNRKSRLVKH